MSKKIYVGNMNYATTEDSLRELFGQFSEEASTQAGLPLEFTAD